MERTVKIIVSGRVQGVAYRYYTREKALKIGLIGTVRNLPEGSVEIIASGPLELIEELISWAHQGSPASNVTGVDVQEWGIKSDFHSFNILR
ncbi:MAG: acylphosphatase [Saprospiraceae bacterium]|nr:acylphosphatase [Saprospiraceae bacterium]